MKKRLLLIVIGLAAHVTIFATTRYADKNLSSNCTTGNYSILNRDCTGSDGNGYTTINGALAVTAAGDVVLVRAGTYNEALTNTIPAGSSTSSRTALRGYPGELPQIKPTSSPSRVID